jgi:hypothetical protein
MLGSGAKPSLYFIHGPSVTSGRILEMGCDYSNRQPNVSIAWHRDNSEICQCNDDASSQCFGLSVNVICKKNIIRISAVTEADAGKYHCVVKRPGSQDESSSFHAVAVNHMHVPKLIPTATYETPTTGGTSIYLKPASTVSVRDNSGGGKATVSSHPYANHTAGWQSTVVETSNNPIKLTETYKSYHTTDGAGTSLITSHQASETITVTPTKMSAGSTNWLSLFVLALSFLCYILL